MNLEWFRQHKKFVYWILLPLVGGSMALFVPGVSRLRSAHTGPTVTLKEYGSVPEVTLPSGDVITHRRDLMQYNNLNRRQVSSDEAALHLVALRAAEASGIEVGLEEAKERVLEEIKSQVERREGSKIEPNEVIYKKLLSDMSLSPARFEGLAREAGVQRKYFQAIGDQGRASDSEIFIEFMREKEVARVRFMKVKSEDYIGKATVPTDDKIKEFYETNKTNMREYKDVLFTKPKIAAEVLYLDVEKALGKEIQATEDELKRTYEKNKDKWKTPGKDGKPDTFKAQADVKAELPGIWKEDELKQYYENYKSLYYKVEPKAGEPKPEPGKEAFKPFAEVKADVEKKWLDEQKRDRPRVRMNALKVELSEAEKAFNAEQEKKPEAERKPFDVGAWAKSKELTYWTTTEQTQDVYKAGKKDANAADAQIVQNLFQLIEESPYPAMNQFNERRRKEFGVIDVSEKGAAVARIKSFTKEQPKTLDEAKPAIIEQLKVRDAIDLAKKEAERIRGEWVEGKNLPSLDALEEVRGDRASEFVLLDKFFEAPKAIGDVLDVTPKPAEDQNKPPFPGAPMPARSNFHEHFLIGIVVDREMPTYDTYKQDSAFDREAKRDQIAQSHAQAMMSAVFRQMKDMAKVNFPKGQQDPDLFAVMRENNEQ